MVDIKKVINEKLEVKDSIEIILTFGTKDIEESWKKGEYGLALLKAAISIEAVLTHHLTEFLASGKSDTVHNKLKKEIENWTLGKLIHWSELCQIFNDSEIKMLEELKNERNDIVHRRGYIMQGKHDLKTREKWENLINFAKNFIDKYGKVMIRQ